MLIAVVALIITAATSGSPHHVARAAPHATPPPSSAAAIAAQRQSAEEAAIDRVLAQTPIVVRGGSQVPEVALTFDDGPGPYTQRLVRLLQKLHAPATFFAIGNQERYFAQGTLFEMSLGYPVENHTETHPFLARLSVRGQRQEIIRQTADVGALGVPLPRLFRPPYGSFNQVTLRELHDARMLMVLWSSDTEDYRRPGTLAIVQRALAGVGPGSIILMHDGGGERSQTIAALPSIVHRLRKRGLKLVTVPRMMLDDPPAPGQPIPPGLNGG